MFHIKTLSSHGLVSALTVGGGKVGPVIVWYLISSLVNVSAEIISCWIVSPVIVWETNCYLCDSFRSKGFYTEYQSP